jgi:hypothetical protein
VRHFAALLLVLTGLGSVAWAKLGGPAWVDAEQRFRALLAQPGEGDAKAELVKLIASDGEPRAWTLLAEGLVLEAGHIARTADQLAKDLTALQELLAKRLKHAAEEEAMFRLQGSVSELEAKKSQDERILRQIAAAFGAADEPGRKLVYARTKAHKDFPVRVAGARVAAILPDEPSSKAMVAEAFKDPDPRVRLALLEGLEKAPGTSWQDGVIARVEDPDWGVQLVAARIIGARELGKGIPALIRALSTSTPRVAEQVVESLRKLTGENIEPYPEPWAKWWEDNRSKWGEDGRPLAPLKAAPRPPGEATFYGLKVRSNRVLYIIDTSLSMKEEKKGSVTPAVPAPKGAVTGEAKEKPAPEPQVKFSGPKIEIAKQELRRSLKMLPKESFFNIISFNHSVVAWQQKMLPATEANKELAYAWIRDMTPAGSTFIDGALRMGFKLAGMGSFDRAYPEVALDTIILLSDGAPTDNAFPESKPMNPDEILDHVKDWNSQRRIVIHCVGIDVIVQGIDFLKKLAAQNGGTYVDG